MRPGPIARVAPWIGAVLLPILAGCGTASPPPLKLTDAEVSQKLVGKWQEEEEGGVVTNVFTPEGKYICEGIERRPGGETKLAINATWQVTNGDLIYTIETSKPAFYKKGDQLKEKVIAIDDREFKYRDIDGKTQIMMRLP